MVNVCENAEDKIADLTHYLLINRLYVQWRFMRGIEAQFLSLQKGFNEIIPQHMLRAFDERELEVCYSAFLINNRPTITQVFFFLSDGKCHGTKTV